MTMTGNCDICARGERALFVCSSPFGPISLAHCQECLDHDAVSVMEVKSLLLGCSGSWDSIRPEAAEGFTVYVDGEYRPVTTITVTPEEYEAFWAEFQAACEKITPAFEEMGLAFEGAADAAKNLGAALENLKGDPDANLSPDPS